MHMDTSGGLKEFLPMFSVLEVSESNVGTLEGPTTLATVLCDEQACSNAVEFDRRLNARPGFVDGGSPIIIAVQRERAAFLHWGGLRGLSKMQFKQHEAEDVIEHPGLHEGDGLVTRRRFFRSVTRLPVVSEVWELPPGASEGSHIHGDERPLEEFYYFIEGQGVMWMDDNEFPVGPGDAVLAPSGVDHGFRSTGDVPLKLVIIWGKPAE